MQEDIQALQRVEDTAKRQYRVDRSSIGALCLAVMIGVSALGCSDKTVWKTEVESPDGRWIASADTVQNGGPGNAYVGTTVYIRGAGGRRPGVEVLEFSCPGPIPHPYVLDNIVNAGGSIHLSMKWRDQTHLQVTYDGHPDLLFQAVKVFQIVNISIQDLSGRSGK